MAPTLVSTKFYAPPLRQDILFRPELSNQLKEWKSKKLYAITAPAGFGKTTLVVDWLAKQSIPSAWVTFDEQDNAHNRFIACLIKAFEVINPSIAKQSKQLLKTLAPFDPREAISEILNDLETLNISCTLVLDDFQYISANEILKSMNFFIKNLPAGICVIMLSRENTELSLSKLRSSGLVKEMGPDFFRFSSEETFQLFNKLNSYNLSQQEINLLMDRTEGWVGGLQLVALSLENSRDPKEFIKRFKGSNRYISDYLVDEVLAQLSCETQELLLVTSILDRFCSDLCKTLIDKIPQEGVQAILEQSSLFIEPLDEERNWFRFHRLFKDLLNTRFQKKISRGDNFYL